MKQRRVAIVAEGHWERTDEESYVLWQGAMERLITASQCHDEATGTFVPRAVVEIIPSLAALRERLAEPTGRPEVVIFRSVGMVEAAKELQREHPNLRVVVFVGILPKSEIIIIEKGWPFEREGIIDSLVFNLS